VSPDQKPESEQPDRKQGAGHKHSTTRIELSNAMFDYIEVFYNRRRRHSRLGHVSPIEYESTLNQETT
jgi:transposase InsO family protein